MKKNIFIPAILITFIMVVLFMIDISIFGIENRYLNTLNMIIIIVILVIIYFIYTTVGFRKIIKLYNEKQFNKVIKKGKHIAKYIVGDYYVSAIYFYMSLTFLNLDEYDDFDEYIKYVTDKKLHEDKMLLTAYRYFKEEKFEEMENIYLTKKQVTDKNKNLYKIDLLIQGAIAYYHNEYEEAQNIFRTYESKEVIESANDIYKKIRSNLK